MKKISISIFALGVITMSSACSIFDKEQLKPEIQVYLLAGQSNMCGVGVASYLMERDLLVPETKVLAYYDGQIASPAFARKMIKLNGYMGTQFGPELSFGLEMEKAYPDDSIALIKWAYGATSLYTDWNPSGTDNNYTKFKDTVIAQMDELSIEYTPVIKGMLWMQGESDACYIEQANAYKENLENFFQTFKSDFGVPDLNIVVGRISDSEAWTFRKVVRGAQEKIVNENENMILVDTDDLTRVDLYHYDSEGLIELGKRFATAMQELINK